MRGGAERTEVGALTSCTIINEAVINIPTAAKINMAYESFLIASQYNTRYILYGSNTQNTNFMEILY